MRASGRDLHLQMREAQTYSQCDDIPVGCEHAGKGWTHRRPSLRRKRLGWLASFPTVLQTVMQQVPFQAGLHQAICCRQAARFEIAAQTIAAATANDPERVPPAASASRRQTTASVARHSRPSASTPRASRVRRRRGSFASSTQRNAMIHCTAPLKSSFPTTRGRRIRVTTVGAGAPQTARGVS